MIFKGYQTRLTFHNPVLDQTKEIQKIQARSPPTGTSISRCVRTVFPKICECGPLSGLADLPCSQIPSSAHNPFHPKRGDQAFESTRYHRQQDQKIRSLIFGKILRKITRIKGFHFRGQNGMIKIFPVGSFIL